METPWKPKHNPWIIAVTVTLATIMEVLDTSIANVASPHIAGALGLYRTAEWIAGPPRSEDAKGTEKLKRCAFGICLAICTGAIHAQDVPVLPSPNGGIAGTVLDTNQDIVPRATVTLRCDEARHGDSDEKALVWC